MSETQDTTQAADGQSSLTDGLGEKLSRFMSYAYQRGRLDALGMPDGPEKEAIIKAVGNLEATRWLTAKRNELERSVRRGRLINVR